jgi:hypothetical protein
MLLWSAVFLALVVLYATPPAYEPQHVNTFHTKHQQLQGWQHWFSRALLSTVLLLTTDTADL